MKLFDQIPLDEMSVSMTMNGVFPETLYCCCRRGVKPEQLSGTIQRYFKGHGA
jgi:methylmalonyl-CoA mutase